MIFLDSLIQGILLGGLYALFAAGLSLVFGIMRLVNLAHGDLIVFGAYLILLLISLMNLNVFIAALVAAPFMFALGWMLQKFVLNRVLGDDILPPLLVTFGLSIVIQNVLLETWSADSKRLSVGALETASLAFGPINVGNHAPAYIYFRNSRYCCTQSDYLPYFPRSCLSSHVR